MSYEKLFLGFAKINRFNDLCKFFLKFQIITTVPEKVYDIQGTVCTTH